MALCWGEGGAGQLGNGNAVDSTTPVTVMDPAGKEPIGGIVAISAGFENACALTSGEALLCWGTNDVNQLGGGTALSQANIPEQVLDSTGSVPLAGVIAITVGQSHSCAVTSLGSALCWEDNAASPAPVSGLSGGVTAIAAGSQHTCAVTSAGAAQCWGSNLDGQIGDGGSAVTSPAPVSPLGVSDIGTLQLF